MLRCFYYSGHLTVLIDPGEKGRGQVRTEKSVPILGKNGMVPDLVIHGQAHEPAKQEIVIQLLHQQPFTADGVLRLQEQGP
jgi:hypothetical protein